MGRLDRASRRRSKATDPQRIEAALWDFIRAFPSAESYDILEEHPELLSEQADAALERAAQAQESVGTQRFMEAFRFILRRCREVGIDAALGELPTLLGGSDRTLLEFINASTWSESRRILERHPKLLRERVDALLELVAVGQESPEAQQLVEERRALLRRCREMGIDAAFRRRRDRPDFQQLLDALQEFVRAPTWEESRDILERHSEVLGDEVDELLEVQAKAQEDPRVWQVIEEHRALLHRCREVGTDAAFGEVSSSPDGVKRVPGGEATVPPTFRGDMRRATEAGDRYLRNNDAGALDQEVTAWERILHHAEFAASEPGFRLAVLNNGARAYLRRYSAIGRGQDLNLALKLLRQALEHAPPGSAERPTILSNLGNGLRDRYALIGKPSDLESAVRAFGEAVEETPPGSPDRPVRLSGLGNGLRDRYALTGKPSDLEEAIADYRQAVEQTPHGSPYRPLCLQNLGNGLKDHYALTGEPSDLEEAIADYRQAVEQTPLGSPDRPGSLSSLGSGLGNRYAQTGDPSDLESAVQAFKEAVEEFPPGSPERPMALGNLGNALQDRYALTRDPSDLESAVRALREALNETASGSPDRPLRLHILGNGLVDRYVLTKDPSDLESAVRACKEAVEETPPGSPDLPFHLIGLGNGLMNRHARTGALSDLDEAIRTYLRAIQRFEQLAEQSPPRSAHRPDVLRNVGIGLSVRYAQVGDLADLVRAIYAWERAWSSLQTTFFAAPVAYKLGQQRTWALLYCDLVTGHLQRSQIDRPQSAAARRRALEVGEGSKSRLLTEQVGRSNMAGPSAIPREKVGQERRLLNELTALDTAELATHGRPATLQEEIGHLKRTQQRERHLRELEGLWEETAKVGPEAADYVALRRGDPPDWEELASLAADLGSETAVLSLFLTPDQTLLFVVRRGWEGPSVVEANVDGHVWRDIARRFRREIHSYDFTGRRGETWDGFLRPLMERVTDHLDGVKRIIFAPHLVGHLLPWAVVAWRAGLRGPDGSAVPLVTLPALGLLPRLRRRRSPGRDTGELVVGNPLKDDPRHDLRYAEQEAQEVAGMLGTEPLIGHQATKEAVLQRLLSASVVHLATHARFEPGSPLDSGIELADGVLTAREVMSHRLRADLMVLSACETGMAGALAGDELAGLAQAFLQAGVRSLVVSLWSVNDPATAALMSAFYGAWLAGADKAVALSQAMAKVRTDQKWEWSHPYFWGAFVLMGDWA